MDFSQFQALQADVAEDVNKGLYDWATGTAILEAAQGYSAQDEEVPPRLPTPPPPNDPSDTTMRSILHGEAQSRIRGRVERGEFRGATANDVLAAYASDLQTIYGISSAEAANKAAHELQGIFPPGALEEGLLPVSGGVLGAPFPDPGDDQQGWANDPQGFQYFPETYAGPGSLDAERAALQAEKNAVDGSQNGGNVAISSASPNPWLQYLRARSLGVDQSAWTPAARYIERQYDPLRALYGAQQSIYQVPSAAQQATPLWETFAGQFPDVAAERARYAELLGALGRMTEQERFEGDLQFRPTEYDRYGDPVETTGQPISLLQTLMRGGLTGSLGARGAHWAAGKVPFFQKQWQLQQPKNQAGAVMPFLQYLRTKFSF